MIWHEIQKQIEEFDKIINNVPGVICHKSYCSRYYTLPTGHILRLADHPSFDYAGQSADIYLHPRGDGRTCYMSQFALRTIIGYNCYKRKNIYFKRKVNVSNFMTALARACAVRKPIAYNPRLQ
jgi:hypothetical protein